MNDRQRAKHNSHLALRTVCNKAAHRSLWSSLPAFVLLYDRFLARIGLVNASLLVQGSDRTGVTEAKNDVRRKLEGEALQIAGALSAYALLTGDADLASQVDVHLTDLVRLPDAEIDDRAQAFLAAARGLPAPAAGQPSAADVGLTAGRLDLLETRIETYNLLLGSPRAARGEKAAATQTLGAALDDIDAILERGLDKLMLGFRDTGFFSEYQTARKIIDPGTPAAPSGAVPSRGSTPPPPPTA